MAQARIAQLANFVSPRSGGMKVAIDQLGAGYQARGAARMIITPGETTSVQDTDEGRRVEIKAPAINSTYRMITRLGPVYQVLEDFRPTSIECSDKWTLAALGPWARKRGIHAVLFSHEHLKDMASGWLPVGLGVKQAVGLRNQRLARDFDVIVVASRYSASEWDGLDVDLRIVPLGVDLETFNPCRGNPDPQGRLRLIHSGRLSHEKHPHLAIEAFKELHRQGVDAEMHVYGSGPDAGALQRLAVGYPIHFHGHLADRLALAEAYASACVSLSVSPTETFGLAVLEALATGTPVVTANRGGALELVDHSCAEWGEPTPVSLATAIARLLKRLGPSLRQAARKRAEIYTWAASVDAMLAIHTEDIREDE